MEIIDRVTAKDIGGLRFFTGIVCKHGHIDERYVSTGGCVACARAHALDWSEKNNEKVLASATKWRLANPEKHKAHLARYRSNNKKVIAEYNRNHHAKNRQKALIRLREWYAAHAETAKEKSRSYSKMHPEFCAAHRNTRRARKQNAGGKHTANDIKKILHLQRYLCAYCKTNVRLKRHVDHIQPLALGGSNGPENLQILCPTCNMKKSARDPIEFAMASGRLL